MGIRGGSGVKKGGSVAWLKAIAPTLSGAAPPAAARNGAARTI